MELNEERREIIEQTMEKVSNLGYTIYDTGYGEETGTGLSFSFSDGENVGEIEIDHDKQMEVSIKYQYSDETQGGARHSKGNSFEDISASLIHAAFDRNNYKWVEEGIGGEPIEWHDSVSDWVAEQDVGSLKEFKPNSFEKSLHGYQAQLDKVELQMKKGLGDQGEELSFLSAGIHGEQGFSGILYEKGIDGNEKETLVYNDKVLPDHYADGSPVESKEKEKLFDSLSDIKYSTIEDVMFNSVERTYDYGIQAGSEIADGFSGDNTLSITKGKVNSSDTKDIPYGLGIIDAPDNGRKIENSSTNFEDFYLNNGGGKNTVEGMGNAYVLSKELQERFTSAVECGDIKVKGLEEISKDNPNCQAVDYEVMVKENLVIPKEDIEVVNEIGRTWGLMDDLAKSETIDGKTAKRQEKEAKLKEQQKDKALKTAPVNKPKR